MPASTLGGPASEFLSILQWRSALEQAKDRGESVDQLRDASTAPSLATPASSNAPASLLRPAQPRKYHFDFPRPGGITERFSVAGSNSPSVAGVSQSPVPAPPAYERVPTPIAKPASARTVHAQAEAHAAPADDEDDERDNDILPPKRRRKSDSVVELLDSDSDDDVVVVRQQSQPHAGRASDEGEANNGGGGGKQHHAASGSRYARAAPARPRQRARVTQGAASRAAASGPSNRVFGSGHRWTEPEDELICEILRTAAKLPHVKKEIMERTGRSLSSTNERTKCIINAGFEHYYGHKPHGQ